MFCSLHVGVRRGGYQMDAPETLTLLVVDEKQKEEEEETIFQENLKSTKDRSHGFGFHRSDLTN